MSHLEEWARLIAKQLKSEAELVGTQAKSELYEDAARDTFTRVVLEPFLPASYAISSGRVIDAAGNISDPQDIVIYRKNYPQFNMPGSHNVFIYESVLATIQVCSKLVRKTFFTALDQCASMSTLEPEIDAETLKVMATKMNMQLDEQQGYVHADPLNTGRFDLIGRPQTFIYAFTGFQTSEKQLTDNLKKWIDHYHQDHTALQLKSMPSVIATQGCFAWRNTAPFMIKDRVLMGVGNDYAPLRLMFLQLMQSMNRGLQNTSDGYGIKSSISPYLNQFERPDFSNNVGVAENPGTQPAAASSPPPAAPAIETATPKVVETASVVSINSGIADKVDTQQSPVESSQSAIKEETPQEAPQTVAAPMSEPSPAVTSNPIAEQAPAVNPPAEPAPSSITPPAADPAPSSIAQAPVEPEPSIAPPSAEPARQEPVIENRSKPLPTREDYEAQDAADGRTPPRPNPLSVMSGQQEEPVDEYEFIPLEQTTTLPDEDDNPQAAVANQPPQQSMAGPAPGDDLPELDASIAPAPLDNQPDQDQPAPAAAADPADYEETQEIDADMKRFEVKQDDKEETEGEFLDTLIEKAEAMKEEESEPAQKKSTYVTESLLR